MLMCSLVKGVAFYNIHVDFSKVYLVDVNSQGWSEYCCLPYYKSPFLETYWRNKNIDYLIPDVYSTVGE